MNLSETFKEKTRSKTGFYSKEKRASKLLRKEDRQIEKLQKKKKKLKPADKRDEAQTATARSGEEEMPVGLSKMQQKP